ncbi:MAG: DUF4012 domain-containing protein, partial [bacterium]|nr:DUF4012 domain-containing protein [bacterium]
MKRVPKKNVSLVLHDVRPPEGVTLRPAPSALNAIPATPKKNHILYTRVENSTVRFASVRDIAPQARNKKEAQKFLRHKKNNLELPSRLSYRTGNKWWKKVAIAISFAVFILGVVYGVGILNFKRDSVASLRSIYGDFQSSVQSFKNWRPEAAKTSLLQADAKLSGLTNGANRYGLFQLSDILDSIIPAFGAVPSVFKNLGSFTNSLLEAAGALHELKTSGLSYFISGDGDKFLALLRTLQKNSDEITHSSTDLINEANTLKNLPLGKEFLNVSLAENLPMLTELYSAKDLLRSLITLLEKPDGFHFALFFQNPSEMRPSGGFIGSYADLFVENGAIKNIDVRDIYDPDGQLDLKVVPPKPLQGTTVSWGARDANWFFDFPKTAAKVLGFLQVSKIYSEKNVTFEGAVALNTDLIEGILGITGPIALPDYNLALAKDNFLTEVQKEVETGTNKELHQPKKILKDFMPLFLASLKNLNDDGKEKLLELVAG